MYIQEAITISNPDILSIRKAEHIEELFKKNQDNIGENKKEWIFTLCKHLHRIS